MSDKAQIHDDDLAAEYVLGVLDADLRAKTAKRVDQDLVFAQLVASWEQRLSGLNEGFEAVQAPAHLKSAIDERLFAPKVTHEGWTMHAMLARFRLPILALILVGVLSYPMISEQFVTPEPQLIYTSDIQSLETYDATFSAQITDQGLTVTQVSGVKPNDKDYELWLVRADGVVLTLGVLSAPLNPQGLAITADSKLAISVEPIGGSPTGVATGPVIALGALKAV